MEQSEALARALCSPTYPSLLMSLTDLIKEKIWGWFSVATSQIDLEPDLLNQILTRSTTAANCFLSPLPVTLISSFHCG